MSPIQPPHARLEDSDDEGTKNSPPSILTQAAIVAGLFGLTAAATYFQAPPLALVPLANLAATSGKSAMRNIPEIQRYIAAGSLMALGFASDYFSGVNLQLGPTALFLAVSVAARDVKLVILGKEASKKAKKAKPAPAAAAFTNLPQP